MKSYDLIVIGGGRASTVAMNLAKAGKRVALIESQDLGGTCPNRGCVPSKLLIGHSDLIYSIKRAKEFGIDVSINNINQKKIFADNKKWIDKVDSRYESRIKDILDIYRGYGKFIENKIIEVNGENLTAKNIIIGTGSSPTPPPKDFSKDISDNLWTSENIFPIQDDNLKSIAIVGGGIIAVELGAFFNAIGVKTTLIVRGDKLLKNEDGEIQSLFQEEFTSKIPTLLNTTISNITNNNQLELELITNTNKVSKLSVDKVLYATGRVPNSKKLELDNTNISTNERGYIEVDKNLRTSVDNVYAMGDVAGNYMFQHSATFEANYLSDLLLGKNNGSISYGNIPHGVFSEPEIASIGPTEEQLVNSDTKYFKVSENFKASARALGMKIENARVKLLFNEDGNILACHIIGPSASTLIHQVMTVMALKGTVYDIKKMIHIHPALSEVILNAAEKAVDVLKK